MEKQKIDLPYTKVVKSVNDFVIGALYSQKKECWDQHYYKPALFDEHVLTVGAVRDNQVGVLKEGIFLVVDKRLMISTTVLKILLLSDTRLYTLVPTIADDRYRLIT